MMHLLIDTVGVVGDLKYLLCTEYCVRHSFNSSVSIQLMEPLWTFLLIIFFLLLDDYGVITLAAHPICNTIQKANRNILSFVLKVLLYRHANSMGLFGWGRSTLTRLP